MTSIWPATLDSFCDEVAAPKPAPAGVAAAAVAGVLGISLLIKTLEITGTRADLIEAARRESAKLKSAADEDIAAVREYMATRDSAAMRKAIEVPMSAARAAVAGLDVCVEAVGIVRVSLVADVGAAAALLAGTVRAILLCVDANLRGHEDSEVSAEREDLETRALQQVEVVVRKVGQPLPGGRGS